MSQDLIIPSVQLGGTIVEHLGNFRKAHAWLDGIPLILEDKAENPYLFNGPDTAVPEMDIGQELTENKLDTKKWMSNRSWHEGAGQKRADMPGVSSEFAYLSSKGIDISEKGEFTLLHETSKIITNTHVATKQKVAVANDNLFTVAAQPNLKKLTVLAGPETDFATGSTKDVVDIASDGEALYIAFGTTGAAEGVHIITAGAASPAVHWSDKDVDVVSFIRGSLYGIGLDAGTGRFQLMELAAGAASVQKHLFRPEETPIQITALGPLVYIPVIAGDTLSRIYAWDGEGVPVIAWELPPGDLVTGMTPFHNRGFLVHVRRYISPTQNTALIYAAFATASGDLTTLERKLLERGDPSDAKDYSMEPGFPWSDEAYFPWPHDDVSGIGVFYPETASWARHVFGDVSGQIGGMTIWRGRRVFTIQGTGLYIEQSTFLSQGHVISSVADANVDTNKLWLVQETGFEPLPLDTKVRHEFSRDGGTTWRGLLEASANGNTLLRSAIQELSPQIQYRITIFSNPGRTKAPKVRKAGIGGWPASKPLPTHTLIVRAYPSETLMTGETRDSTDGGWQLLKALETRRASGNVFPYQPPWYIYDQTQVLRARIANIRTFGPWGVTGERQGGLIELTLKVEAA